MVFNKVFVGWRSKNCQKRVQSRNFLLLFLGHPVASCCSEQSIFGLGHFDESMLHRWRWWPTRVESPTDNNHSNIDGAAALCSMSQETRHVVLKIFLFWSTPKIIFETTASLLLFLLFFKVFVKSFGDLRCASAKSLGLANGGRQQVAKIYVPELKRL